MKFIVQQPNRNNVTLCDNILVGEDNTDLDDSSFHLSVYVPLKDHWSFGQRYALIVDALCDDNEFGCEHLVAKKIFHPHITDRLLSPVGTYVFFSSRS